MQYGTFKRFSLDPQNEQEVLEKAITRAYQASSGKLNAFNAGSPLVVLLESLVSTQMEWLFWLNSMPEAMILSYLSEVLGAGRNYGSKASVTLEFTLTKALTSPFFLSAGTTVYSKNNNGIFYNLENNFTILPGQTVGYTIAKANKIGISSQVFSNELTVLAENYAYLKSVTNPSASTLGSDFETLSDMALRVQALMSQTTPVSALDWLNMIEKYYPNSLAEVQNYDGVLYLYIQDYVTNNLFENYCKTVKGLLQTVEIQAYKKALLQIRIEPMEPFTSELCLEVTKNLSNYLKKAKPLQAIDLYQVVLNTAGKIDLNNFDVLYYYTGLNELNSQAILLKPFDFVSGQVLKDLFTSFYYLVNNSFNTVVSAFDECELGYLSYHPVYTQLGPGNYSGGDIVKIGPQYYLITNSGNFDPSATTNWILLTAPKTWVNSLLATVSDWFFIESPIAGLGHGFIPEFSYTTSNTVNSNLTQISPNSKITGQSVAPGEYFYRVGFEPIIYYNNLTVNYIVNPFTLQSITQVDLQQKPDAIYSKLSRKSKFTIGHITSDNNYIYTTSEGNKVSIATGLNIPASVVYPEPLYGTLILADNSVYEVIQAFVPAAADTIQSLLTSKTIKKAYKKYSDYEVISTTFSTPYYFDIEFVLFDQFNDIVVSKELNLGNYSLS